MFTPLYLFRCKSGERFLQLARLLKKKVGEICQQYFKFLKFICGPPCPNEACLGAKFNADQVQRPCESSSSESEKSSDSGDGDGDGDGDANFHNQDQVNGKSKDCNPPESRRHVISINPDSFDPPYWCRAVDVTESLNDWNPEYIAQVLKFFIFQITYIKFIPYPRTTSSTGAVMLLVEISN
jgi:hypothetical protein